jgi:hypothetical protein
MTVHAFDFVTINGTLQPGVFDASVDFRETVLADTESGQSHQTYAAVIQRAPMARWSTRALDSLVDLLAAGAAVPCIVPTALVLTAPRVAAATVGFQAASSQTYTFAVPATWKPLIVLERISWQIGQAAEVTLAAYAVSADGAADSLAPATGAAVPGTVSGLGERLVLTAATLGGQALTGLQSVEITVGHNVENNRPECYNQGLPEPVLLSQPGVGEPAEITARLRATHLPQTITSGSLVLHFARIDNNGVGVGTNLVTVTLRAALARRQTVGGRPAMQEILAHGTFDGANAPLSVAAFVA